MCGKALVGQGGCCLKPGVLLWDGVSISALLTGMVGLWALWARFWGNPGTQGANEVEALSVLPSGHDICGEPAVYS